MNYPRRTLVGGTAWVRVGKRIGIRKWGNETDVVHAFLIHKKREQHKFPRKHRKKKPLQLVTNRENLGEEEEKTESIHHKFASKKKQREEIRATP